jgi:hypothetical protein
MKKGQALLLVLFMFIIVSILTGALAGMWTAEIKTRSLERDSLAAFYLAQAGIENGKLAIWYYAYYGYSRGSYVGEMRTLGEGFYIVRVYPLGYSVSKTLVSTGIYGNSQRIISVRIAYPSAAWTWQEQ